MCPSHLSVYPPIFECTVRSTLVHTCIHTPCISIQNFLSNSPVRAHLALQLLVTIAVCIYVSLNGKGSSTGYGIMI